MKTVLVVLDYRTRKDVHSHTILFFLLIVLVYSNKHYQSSGPKSRVPPTGHHRNSIESFAVVNLEDPSGLSYQNF